MEMILSFALVYNGSPFYEHTDMPCSLFQVVKLSEIVTLAKEAHVDVKFQLPI